jgi:hypothetical protein
MKAMRLARADPCGDGVRRAVMMPAGQAGLAVTVTVIVIVMVLVMVIMPVGVVWW